MHAFGEYPADLNIDRKIYGVPYSVCYNTRMNDRNRRNYNDKYEYDGGSRDFGDNFDHDGDSRDYGDNYEYDRSGDETIANSGKRRSPFFVFLLTLILILGAGTILICLRLVFSAGNGDGIGSGLFRAENGNASGKDGGSEASDQAAVFVSEEPIPDDDAASGTDSDSENAGESSSGNGSSTGAEGLSGGFGTDSSGDDASVSPTASENIVKTSAGTYSLTSTQNPDSITFAFAGDILFDTRYAAAASIVQRGGNIENSFDEETLNACRTADVFMVNNEFPYSSRGTPLAGKQYTFRADPSTAEWLTEMGADIVSLANNHCFDYGEEALLDTLDTLDSIGMIHVGAGHNLDEASEPAVFECGGMKIAILNATMIEQGDNPETRGATDTQSGVFRCWDWTNLVNKIKEVDAEVDETIVYIHWGTEKRTDADWSQTQCAAALEEAGADFIIGDHPHVLEPFASDGHTFVCYSLGNFLFTSFTTDTGLLEVTFTPSSKSVSGIRFIPMLQSDSSVRTLSGLEKERVLNFMRTGSAGVTVDEDGNITLNGQ